MTPDAKLVEEAKAWKVAEHISNGIPCWVSLNKGNPMLPFAYIHEDEAEMIVQLATALSASATREKAWHDNVMLASGGHATTPETAREFINSLRDMLDVAKGETKAAVEREKGLREACTEALAVVDEAYAATGFIRIAKTSEQRQKIAAALAQETK